MSAIYKTAPRDAIMLRDYPRGVATNDIIAELNALPGAPINVKQFTNYARSLLCHRPDGFKPNTKRKVSAERGPYIRYTPGTKPENQNTSVFKQKYVKPQSGRDGYACLSATLLNESLRREVTAPITELDVALSWGRRHGLRDQFGLADVNKLRLSFSLTPFSLVR